MCILICTRSIDINYNLEMSVFQRESIESVVFNRSIPTCIHFKNSIYKQNKKTHLATACLWCSSIFPTYFCTRNVKFVSVGQGEGSECTPNPTLPNLTPRGGKHREGSAVKHGPDEITNIQKKQKKLVFRERKFHSENASCLSTYSPFFAPFLLLSYNRL